MPTWEAKPGLGFGAIVNTGAIVSHDCILGDYVNLSPGAILAGEVSVGSAALVGMGVTVNLRVTDWRTGSDWQWLHRKTGCPRRWYRPCG